MRLNLSACLMVGLLAVGSAFSQSAHASIHISGEVATSFPSSGFDNVSSPSLLLAGELTFGLSDLFQMGAVYDRNFLSYKNSGGNDTEKFYGAIVRIGTLVSGLFADAQAGVCARGASDTSFSYGIGAGYTIPMNWVLDVAPRVSYRSLPDSGATRSMVDVGLLFTFKIL